MSTAPLPPESTPSRPFLVPTGPAPRSIPSPLALWHLLSLDAPAVAAVWTTFVAWCAGVRLSPLDPLGMFLAVWMLYAGDRLLDAQPLFTAPLTRELEARHHFHHRHRKGFLTGILVVALPLTVLLHRSHEAVLHLYILLASLLGVWLLLVHAQPRPSATTHRLPKELAVGLFFPAAVFIPTVARAPALRLALLPVALAFASICTLNCLFLYVWEHPRGRGYAHRSTRMAIRHLKLFALLCILAPDALSLALTTGASTGPAAWLSGMPHAASAFLACALSGALLLILHASRNRLAPLHLRALADLVLLTPLPLVAVHLALRHG